MPFARIALVAFLIPSGAVAAGFAGTFEHKQDGYEQGARVKVSGGGYTGNFSTATNRGCGGEVTMKGRATGPSTVVFSKADDGQVCRITARYGAGFRTVDIEEDGCTMWHGASCEFQGTLKRSRP